MHQKVNQKPNGFITQDSSITMIAVIVFALICLNVCPSFGCLDGSNENLGAVVEPNTKNFPVATERSDSEITRMVKILSSRFNRISLYANDVPDSTDSKILLEVAEVNSRNTKGPMLNVVAALHNPDEKSLSASLDNALRNIAVSNKIYPGTVTRLIISSSYFKEFQDFQYEDVNKFPISNMDQRTRFIPLLSNFQQPMQEFLAMSRRVKRAQRQLNGTNLKLGIRSGNCDDVGRKLCLVAEHYRQYGNYMDVATKFIEKLVGSLDFIVCRQLPSASATAKESATSLIVKMGEIHQFFTTRWPSLQVIMETGWPTEGDGASGFETGVSSMKTFWCAMGEWSRNKSVQLDFYTAFDEIQAPDKAALTNYGWWIRIPDGQNGTPNFYEKINYNPPAGKSTIIIILTVSGCLALIAVVIILAYFKVISAKGQLLSKQELNEFNLGYEGLKRDRCEDKDVLGLAYDSAFEMAESQFLIDESKFLGKGEFGLVFKGKVYTCDKEVAFKVTQPDCTATNLKYLLSEIKILIHVGNHPNVVSIIGAYTEEIQRGKVVIAIELCENGSLEKYLKSQKTEFGDKMKKQDRPASIIDIGDNSGRIPITMLNIEELVKKLLYYAYEISKGMEHIAWRKIIHADLAARNVLLTVNGTAKITDFGLSKRLYEYTNYVKKNQEPMPWRWMALESLEQLSFSTKSDVWSFGVTLYEIFSLGDIPYPGLSWNQDFKRQLREGLQLDRPSWAPLAIYEIMKSCFVLDPNKRPRFVELKIALENIFPDLERNEYLHLNYED